MIIFVIMSNFKYNESIFKMVGDIFNDWIYPVVKFKVDGICFEIKRGEWESNTYTYLLEVGEDNEVWWGYNISIGISSEEHYKNIYPNGIFLHYTTDGFYNLTEKYGYITDDGTTDDGKFLFDYLTKHMRNIKIGNLVD